MNSKYRTVPRVEYLASGRTRSVFRLWPSGRFVVKVPIDDLGFFDNYSEAAQWRQGDESWLYRRQKARCRLLPNGWLIMEYVRPTQKSYSELPSWVGAVDCGQVGFTLDGRLVAYDYA